MSKTVFFLVLRPRLILPMPLLNSSFFSASVRGTDAGLFAPVGPSQQLCFQLA